jgi:hypothetical protein
VGEKIRQSDTADPDGQEGDVLVERSLSACVTIADEENARKQQDAHSYECEGAELSAERVRCWDADYRREKDSGLDN